MTAQFLLVSKEFSAKGKEEFGKKGPGFAGACQFVKL
jgi:hypothetical protein